MRAEISGVAVSDIDGTVQFHVEKDQTGASHITENGGISVPTVRLDCYLQEKNVNQVALLKLDVEGYELKALQGAENALRAHRVSAVYFEYFEKFLIRVAPPSKLIEYFDSLSYEVCFCRLSDLKQNGTALVTLRSGLPGNGLPLIPIKGRSVPAMTDLLAVPKENLMAIA
jgi:methyltransferase FkbM-like protein